MGSRLVVGLVGRARIPWEHLSRRLWVVGDAVVEPWKALALTHADEMM